MAQNANTRLRILIATDAWRPQVNGVVQTLETLCRELVSLGHDICVIEPGRFRTIPCPTYPEIRLAMTTPNMVSRIIDEFAPTNIHIATEGPLGLATRRCCVKRGMNFTTSFHTRFPEYVHARTRIPLAWTYGLIKWFHGRAAAVMVATQSLKDEMAGRGLTNIAIWSRGVDIDKFHPRRDKSFLSFKRPIWLYVGRIAVEKNIKSFLDLDLEGTKLLVGDGPQRDELERNYPTARFVGPKYGKDLAEYYAASDVFVFPSKTDTFGLVIIEALASGVPVAAYPVQGPADIVGGSPVGVLDENLEVAARRALTEISPAACRAHALEYTWAKSARQFLSNVAFAAPAGTTSNQKHNALLKSEDS